MTELSPAAKAVLIADAKSRCLREDRGCNPVDDDWNGCWYCVHRRDLATALRAAADQLGFVVDDGTRLINSDELRAIADELEAQ